MHFADLTEYGLSTGRRPQPRDMSAGDRSVPWLQIDGEGIGVIVIGAGADLPAVLQASTPTIANHHVVGGGGGTSMQYRMVVLTESLGHTAAGPIYTIADAPERVR